MALIADIALASDDQTLISAMPYRMMTLVLQLGEIRTACSSGGT